MEYDYLKQKRILLVDDEEELRELVTSILTQEGYAQVRTAGTVADALSLAEAWKPELAILDVMLPDGDGFELLSKLRGKGDIPALFLTARGEEEDKFRGFGLGADDYVVKPFLPRELLFRIAAVLRRSYKDNALGFFKAFLTALEESNPGYRFDSRNINGLVGKRMGVVLGEEEYQKRNGEIGERPYVYQVRSLAAIQSGDFKVPELKCLDAKKPSGGSAPAFPPPPAQSYGRSDFSYMDEDDGELPF